MHPVYPDLSGRRYLVTGASSGIGLVCARMLAEQGSKVLAQYRGQNRPVEDLTQAFPGAVFGLQADLAEESGCVRAVTEAGRILGGLDGIVHSAGIWNDGHIRTLTRENLETMFRTNTFSSYYLCREFARAFQGGCIAIVGSTAGQRGEPEHSHYAGSKGAVQSMVMSLAQELAPHTRVNLVSPGWVNTPMSEEALKVRGEKIVSAVPLRRVAESEDVAASILFLLSDAGRHFTGADLCCSGGALLPMPRG